ncbi:MAG: hypothetical protein M0Q22_12045 [Sulfuritalea sp.]|jgi:hypothetical protein|nr:hypothetical protein [Sulfuritalea sp.]
MAMSKSEVEPFLLSLGFALEHSSGFGDEFAQTLSTGWKLNAYASKEGNPFSGTEKHDSYDEVSFTLDSKGTRHRCVSLSGLKKHAGAIIKELLRVSKNDDLLKCPKCKTRYVHAKEPTQGQRWKPFLSCDGMMVVGQGAKKHVGCDGVSQKLPAVVVYK